MYANIVGGGGRGIDSKSLKGTHELMTPVLSTEPVLGKGIQNNPTNHKRKQKKFRESQKCLLRIPNPIILGGQDPGPSAPL